MCLVVANYKNKMCEYAARCTTYYCDCSSHRVSFSRADRGMKNHLMLQLSERQSINKFNKSVGTMTEMMTTQ